MAEIEIQVLENQKIVHSAKSSGLVELGRQADREGPPFATYEANGRLRIVFARMDEQSVSRHHFTAESVVDGQVRVTNTSRTPLWFIDGIHIDPGATQELTLPVFLVFGTRNIGLHAVQIPVTDGGPKVVRPTDEDSKIPLQTLAAATRAPGTIAASRPWPETLAAHELRDDTMIRWLQAAMEVLQSAASSTEFFDKAAAALVDLVGLDCGQVLLHKNGNWLFQARKTGPGFRPTDERPPSRKVLSSLLSDKRTVWQVPPLSESLDSLAGVAAVVAAPILDKCGAVLGALYGDRRSGGGRTGRAGLTQLDAMLVELLAGGVAAGVARIEQEQTEQQRQQRILLYEKEMQIGRKIQTGFLPAQLPKLEGWELVAHFQPARDVAGDFYDCFALSENQVVLIIADVCDKGVGSALFMALFRSLIRAFCQQTGLSMFLDNRFRNPEGIGCQAVLPANRHRASLLADLVALLAVENTNRYVTGNHAEECMFVTLFLGVLDTASGELSYVNAGHDSPAVIGPQGVKARLGLDRLPSSESFKCPKPRTTSPRCSSNRAT